MDTREGGCLCGAVRYRVKGEPRVVALCHCGMCRRVSGAPVMAWATFPKDAVVLLSGAPSWYASSDHARRGACPNCSSQLLFESRRYPGELDVAATSLDDPSSLRPDRHIFWPERLNWLQLSDELPRHEGDTDTRRIG